MYIYTAMKLLKYIPAIFSVLIIIGIIFGFYIETPLVVVIISIIIFLILLYISYKYTNNNFNKSFHFTIITCSLFFIIGIASITFQKYKSNNYINFIKNNNKIIVQINSKVNSNKYYDKYYGTIIQLNDRIVNGKILVNAQLDKNNIVIGDVIYLNTNFREIKKPINPYQFNYQKYLEKKQIYHQITINKNDYILINHINSINARINNLQKSINLSLKKYNFKKDELSIINAIILGQRKDISKELMNNYIGAGAIHILAVSGLHIGILLLILNFIFKPIEYLKKGKLIKVIIIIILLWSYAFIAGLSPSIIRATSMFTAISIGNNLNRKTSTLHSLFISLFILLLLNPLYIFQVGFQLSYLAVFSIVYFYPLFIKLYNPNFWLFRKLWQLFSISVSAQVGVLPLSLFYFHQFPSLFFASSMVIIPFLGLILSFGILVIILSVFNILPIALANIFSWIIHQMNLFIEFISNQESFLFKNISFSIMMLITLYFIIISFYHFWNKPNSKTIKVVLASIILFQIGLIFEKYKLNNSNQFIVLNQSRKSVFIERQNNKINIFNDLDSKTNNTINNYKIGVGVNKSTLKTLKNILKIETKSVLIVDSFNVYKIPKLKADFIILRQSPKINLNRLIAINKPKIIIADGSNYKNIKSKWKNTCEKLSVKFHDTSVDGAFIYDY